MVAVVVVVIFSGCVEEEAPTPTPVSEQAKEFSNFEITKVIYENGQVKVFGTTDLPDGAILMMQLDAPTGLCAQGKSKVENGEFTMVFGPFSEHYDFDTKPYEVSALLTPINQPDSVSKLVGEKGERLTGNLVRYNSLVGNILETKRKFNTQYASPAEYPMVDPNSYATGTPERAFAEYLNCWKQEDWDRMVEFTQKTWRSDEDNPAEFLKANYDFKHLVGVEITKKTVTSDTFVQVEAKVYYCAFSATVPTEKKITANVIRESTPYTPSSTGDWGVNPLSTLREE
jgi:hypothetical protein